MASASPFARAGAPRGVALRLAPLFLVSMVAIGFEIALTRFFAIVNWSEYAYWVISITMFGLATSGVVLSLFRESLERRAAALLGVIPLLLIPAASLGFYFFTINPFNPLELQNPILWQEQLLNISKYYLALFPFFFLTGLFIGLCFLAYQQEIPRVYAADLIGAGVGALAILWLMAWIHPFYLLAALLPLLVPAALLSPLFRGAWRLRLAVLLAVLLVSGEALVLFFNPADFNTYKRIYAALRVAGNRVVEEIISPRGYFLVLENFTERLDTDFSNNIGLLGVAEPPLSYGLYRNGDRLTSLPTAKPFDPSYVEAALDSAPYTLLHAPRVLLIGSRGGFRLREALELGATQVRALEPDPTLFRLVRDGVGGRPLPAVADPRVRTLNLSPADYLKGHPAPFDLVDISSDFLNQGAFNRYAFTVEALRAYWQALKPGGLISLPVSIQEFSVYSIKMLDGVRAALRAEGIAAPERHILVYRSAWNLRIMVSRAPLEAAQIKRVWDFAEQRSFDVSYFTGIRPKEVKVWNDLPMVSFESEQVVSTPGEASDAVRSETLSLFGPNGERFLNNHFFRLRHATDDRPFFYGILDWHRLPSILARIDLIPREEVGYLVNLAVLIQSALFAVVVLLLPLLRWRKRLPGAATVVKAVLYFASLGLGYLFLEIFLIEKALFLLHDATFAFALVLAGMLIFSGLGSYLAERFLTTPARGVRIAIAVVLLWSVLAYAALNVMVPLLVGLPLAAKSVALALLIAPLAVALGLPFPLGLHQFRGERSNFLPWAWSLNGAFSVISTPLANLVAISSGLRMLLLVAALVYAGAMLTFPAARGRSGMISTSP